MAQNLWTTDTAKKRSLARTLLYLESVKGILICKRKTSSYKFLHLFVFPQRNDSERKQKERVNLFSKLNYDPVLLSFSVSSKFCCFPAKVIDFTESFHLGMIYDSFWRSGNTHHRHVSPPHIVYLQIHQTYCFLPLQYNVNRITVSSKIEFTIQ